MLRIRVQAFSCFGALVLFWPLGCRSNEPERASVAAASELAGGTPCSVARPLLTSAQAEEHTTLSYLAQAGNLTTGLVTDHWDPSHGVGDVGTVKPTFTVAIKGGTHSTVQQAIDSAVKQGGNDRLFIQIVPGTYREVVCVPDSAPPITLYGVGSDPRATVVVFDNFNGKTKAPDAPANPCNPNLAQPTYGTGGSATFAVYSAGFEAKNLTIANDADETAIPTGTQAVALLTQADQLTFENVALLGNQDTLYVKTVDPNIVSRAYFKSCYVEGDIDFIFGRGTFVLNHCTIHYLTSRQRDKGGFIVAPSTDSRNPRGILIINSQFTAEPGTPNSSIYLGRAWDESQGDVTKYAANVASGVHPNGEVVIRDSQLGPHIRVLDPWGPSTVKRPYNSVADTFPANRFYEHNNRSSVQ